MTTVVDVVAVLVAVGPTLLFQTYQYSAVYFNSIYFCVVFDVNNVQNSLLFLLLLLLHLCPELPDLVVLGREHLFEILVGPGLAELLLQLLREVHRKVFSDTATS